MIVAHAAKRCSRCFSGEEYEPFGLVGYCQIQGSESNWAVEGLKLIRSFFLVKIFESPITYLCLDTSIDIFILPDTVHGRPISLKNSDLCPISRLRVSGPCQAEAEYDRLRLARGYHGLTPTSARPRGEALLIRTLTQQGNRRYRRLSRGTWIT